MQTMRVVSLSHPRPSMGSAILDVRQANRFTTVTLVCGQQGTVLFAHQVFLVERSPYLRRILMSCPEHTQYCTICLPTVEPAHMEALLHYMYSGQLTVSMEDFEGQLGQAIRLLELEYLSDLKDLSQPQLQMSSAGPFQPPNVFLQHSMTTPALGGSSSMLFTNPMQNMTYTQAPIILNNSMPPVQPMLTFGTALLSPAPMILQQSDMLAPQFASQGGQGHFAPVGMSHSMNAIAPVQTQPLQNLQPPVQGYQTQSGVICTAALANPPPSPNHGSRTLDTDGYSDPRASSNAQESLQMPQDEEVQERAGSSDTFIEQPDEARESTEEHQESATDMELDQDQNLNLSDVEESGEPEAAERDGTPEQLEAAENGIGSFHHADVNLMEVAGLACGDSLQPTLPNPQTSTLNLEVENAAIGVEPQLHDTIKSEPAVAAPGPSGLPAVFPAQINLDKPVSLRAISVRPTRDLLHHCTRCKASFKKRTEFHKHLFGKCRPVACNTKNTLSTCEVCDRTFGTRRGMKNHYFLVHLPDEMKEKAKNIKSKKEKLGKKGKSGKKGSQVEEEFSEVERNGDPTLEGQVTDLKREDPWKFKRTEKQLVCIYCYTMFSRRASLAGHHVTCPAYPKHLGLETNSQLLCENLGLAAEKNTYQSDPPTSKTAEKSRPSRSPAPETAKKSHSNPRERKTTVGQAKKDHQIIPPLPEVAAYVELKENDTTTVGVEQEVVDGFLNEINTMEDNEVTEPQITENNATLSHNKTLEEQIPNAQSTLDCSTQSIINTVTEKGTSQNHELDNSDIPVAAGELQVQEIHVSVVMQTEDPLLVNDQAQSPPAEQDVPETAAVVVELIAPAHTDDVETNCSTTATVKDEIKDSLSMPLATGTSHKRKQSFVALSDKSNYCCPYCGEECVKETWLAEHLRQDHPSTLFQCPTCNKLLRTHQGLVVHMSRTHNQFSD